MLTESSTFLYPFLQNEKAFEFSQGIDHIPPASACSISPTSPYFQRVSGYKFPIALESNSFGAEDLFTSDLMQSAMSDAYSSVENYATADSTQNASELKFHPANTRSAHKKRTHPSDQNPPKDPLNIITQPQVRYSGCKRGRPLLYVTASSKRERHNENERQRVQKKKASSFIIFFLTDLNYLYIQKQIGEMREALRLLQEKRNNLLSTRRNQLSDNDVTYRHNLEEYALLMKKTDLLKEEQFQLGFAVWESRATLMISISSSKTHSR